MITFAERSPGKQEALRAWFYPGRNLSEEFRLSKAKAMAPAKAANAPVLFTSARILSKLSSPSNRRKLAWQWI